MGKKKDKKKKKQKEQELIPPVQNKPEGPEEFTGSFKEFKEMVYGLEPNSGAHYFKLPFGEIMANITSKRSLKKKGFPGPGAYTWAKCQADFENGQVGSESEDHPEAEELKALFESKYKRKEFKAHLEINSDFDRETIDQVVALIPKKKATGVLLNSLMMQNLKMPSSEATKVLVALSK